MIEPTVRVVVPLGGLAWNCVARAMRSDGWLLPRPRQPFGHAARFTAHSPTTKEVEVLGSYHPSQQNTFTKRLTEPMLDGVLAAARQVAGS